jgi:hypothetical protein
MHFNWNVGNIDGLYFFYLSSASKIECATAGTSTTINCPYVLPLHWLHAASWFGFVCGKVGIAYSHILKLLVVHTSAITNTPIVFENGGHHHHSSPQPSHFPGFEFLWS